MKMNKETVLNQVMAIAEPLYKTGATKRNELQYRLMLDDAGIKFLRFFGKELILPVMASEPFRIHTEDGLLDVRKITEKTEQIITQENQLLGKATWDNSLVEVMPFNCYIWQDKETNWWGTFRVIVNSDATPTLEEVNEAVTFNE